MKKILLILLTLSTFSCVSTKKYNAEIFKPISVIELQKDVDYIHHKMNKLHPKIDFYISQKVLDNKFDSLKNSIKTPMDSYTFYTKLAPVLSEIRQGHIYSMPRTQILKKKELKILNEKGVGPFSQFDFEIFNNKMYVVKDKTKQKNIPIGSEIVSINNLNVSELLTQSKELFSSDGFNETLFPHYLDNVMISNFSFKNGLKDSIQFEMKFKDSIFIANIKREKTDSTSVSNNNLKKKKYTEMEKDSIKKVKEFRRINGYDEKRKQFNHLLTFQDADSCIAVMKINSFTLGDYEAFYQNSFELLKTKKTQTLILDLRNNGGGALSDCTELYSYLSPDESFTMIDQQLVTEKTSMLHIPIFSQLNFSKKLIVTPFLPIFYSVIYLKTLQNENGEYYFDTKFSKPRNRKENYFDGKVYVLINGGSFSATSIISSHLKSSKKGYFVGEETGGEYNGTVAGALPFYTLPNSKVKVRFGLQWIAPTVKSKIFGRGIFPDKKILPTIEDRIENKDPEMEWILNEIKNQSTNSKLD